MQSADPQSRLKIIVKMASCCPRPESSFFQLVKHVPHEHPNISINIDQGCAIDQTKAAQLIFQVHGCSMC